MTSKKTCLVIGAGIAGLAAAIRMAHKGYAVSVLDKNAQPGGKLSEVIAGNYRFDFGPSLFTLPEHLEELFSDCNRSLSDYLHYSPINPGHRYFYEDGKTFDAYQGAEKFAEEAERVFGEPKQRTLTYLKKSARKYSLTKDTFLSKSLHKASTYLSWKVLKSFLFSYQLDAFKTLHQLHAQTFKSTPLVQLFDRYATYNGSNPYKAPATLSLIPHLEINNGVYYPTGGMFAITKALVRLAEELGVRIEFNTWVEELILEKNTAIGIRTNDKIRKADCIISSMDIFYTYSKLLPTFPKPTRILDQEKSSSALVFYWGIKKSFPNLLLHNILWSRSYEKEFNELYTKKSISDDPTLYINISSKHSPEDAPEGCENWFVMVNVPHDSGQDWECLLKKTRENTIAKINSVLNTNIEAYIEVEEQLTPTSMDQKTLSAFGALYGNSSNTRWASFLRHANAHSTISNLYFCGGTVHPGGGLPLCLRSAKIATDLIPSALVG